MLKKAKFEIKKKKTMAQNRSNFAWKLTAQIATEKCQSVIAICLAEKTHNTLKSKTNFSLIWTGL